MRALVRAICSTDIDVESYQSETPEDDGQWIRLLVGPDNGPGEESFDVLVCTSTWLARRIGEYGSQLVRHALVMDQFDLQDAIEILRGEVALVSGENWRDLTMGLVQIGRWEFQDYYASPQG